MIELSCFNDKGKKVSTLKPLKVTGHYQQLCKVGSRRESLIRKKIREDCFTQFNSLFFIQVKIFPVSKSQIKVPRATRFEELEKFL